MELEEQMAVYQVPMMYEPNRITWLDISRESWEQTVHPRKRVLYRNPTWLDMKYMTVPPAEPNENG